MGRDLFVRLEEMTEPENIERDIYYYESTPPVPVKPNWLKHLLLLLLTFCTVTVAGTMFPFGPYDTLPGADPQSFQELVQMILSLPSNYAALIGDAVYALFTREGYLAYGLSFSLSLLFILICHEMGHYIACRIYKVDASLPFFLPTPPMVGPAGTFGAFIKIRSPMPSRKAVFDIGVAGPIAGFIALLPIAAIGVFIMEPASPQHLASSSGITFTDPLLMRIFGALLGHDPSLSIRNAFYYAAWVGLLVTALNLIPSGQLDGGHAVFAALGEKIHYWTGRVAFVVMAVLSVLGLIFFNSPSGFLIAIILGVMMRVRHPIPYDQTPLDKKRKLIAFATLIIFILCFVPFPIRIN